MPDNEPHIKREFELKIEKWKVSWKRTRTDEGNIARFFLFISAAPKKLIPFICVLGCFIYYSLKESGKVPASIYIPTISFLFIALIASLWLPLRNSKK